MVGAFGSIIRPAMTARPQRLLVIAVAVLTAVLSVMVIINSAVWFNRTFPGFFVMANRVVPSVALPDWIENDAPRLFQHQVIAIDGETVSSSTQVYDRVGDMTPGTPVSYTLRSSDGTTSIVIERARVFSATDYALVFGAFLFSGLVFVAVGLAVFWMRPDKSASLGLLSVCLSVGLFVITATDLYGPHWFFRLHVLAECFMAPAMIHFALVFPTDRLRAHRRVVFSVVYAPFVGLALVYEALLYSPTAYSAAHLAASIAHGVAGLAIIGSVIHGLATTRSPLLQRRVGVLAVGIFSGVFMPSLLLGTS